MDQSMEDRVYQFLLLNFKVLESFTKIYEYFPKLTEVYSMFPQNYP